MFTTRFARVTEIAEGSKASCGGPIRKKISLFSIAKDLHIAPDTFPHQGPVTGRLLSYPRVRYLWVLRLSVASHKFHEALLESAIKPTFEGVVLGCFDFLDVTKSIDF